jgi:hypothetical protein
MQQSEAMRRVTLKPAQPVVLSAFILNATGDGTGLEMTDEIKQFAKLQGGRTRQSIQPNLASVPEWLWQLPLDKRSPESIIEEVIKRVMEKPDEFHLRLAQVVLTELGRDPKVAALLSHRLTPEVLRGLKQ